MSIDRSETTTVPRRFQKSENRPARATSQTQTPGEKLAQAKNTGSSPSPTGTDTGAIDWPRRQFVLLSPSGVRLVPRVLDGNDELVRELASDIPDHPPNFQRVKRTNVGQESVPAEELAELELGPNNCAAE